MKKGHLLGLGVIAIAIIIIISMIGDASTYESFATAKNMMMKGDEKPIHVVGELKKGENGTVEGIEVNPNKTSFYFKMVDNDGTEQKVFYNEPVPPDFARAEQVVVIGSYKNEELFVADKILMKCPSKYQETDIAQAGM
ncbi:cytochrome c maturation protein CcmE domain-containing protein [Mongoliitalea daihaiensis]|uniref:cytochrome c maturation protein CcmE domain-containing protein n=1 Tax=Mongoliitalea daihaiensis TaxID=2782006 RepID=UPI001F1715B1|nr:cytochrome c maturation protein CcmE [Mongoliitalea daihaiensis]UJP65473.1 cytochrome c maturation protein CcmE [Mongoliitalea daihaiensis]